MMEKAASLLILGRKVDIYQAHGKTWFLGNDLQDILKRDPVRLMRQFARLSEPRMTVLALVEGSRRKRRYFTVMGARMLAAMTPTQVGMDLFNLLCIFETDGRKFKRKKCGSQ